ncbi:OPT oligopeptide transporter protein-domain-containing protein [Obelidium mucronatum]|nr:OPT oligopeptide transporter protein-domain-containing protein [Obelidium mucronatum]
MSESERNLQPNNSNNWHWKSSISGKNSPSTLDGEVDYERSKYKHSDASFDDYGLHQEEEAEEDQESPDYILSEVYDIVDSVVPRTDDPMQPTLTFRVVFLGFFFGILLSIVNTVFTFRSNFFMVNPFVILLVTYPLGNLMYWTTSTKIYTVPYFKYQFTFNPGPFSFKEHTLGNPAYSLYNVVVQKYLLKQDISILWCIAFAIVTQVTGYGVAGLCRRFLVRPAVMLWPGTLTVISSLTSMHEPSATAAAGGGVLESEGQEEGDQVDRKSATRGVGRGSFFWLCALGMCIYQFFPSYVAPLLGTVSVLCYLGPFNQKLHMLGSATQGVGLLSFSFDWSIIGSTSPIISPLWAVINRILGTWLFYWLVVPLLWLNNTFGADQQLGTNPFQGPNGTGQYPLGQALNTVQLFNKNGLAISPLTLVTNVNKTYVLNQTMYDMNKPVYVTTFYAVQMLVSLLAFASALSHTALWYGKDIYHRYTTAMRDLDSNDIHAQLMDQYNEVPDNWYAILVCAGVISAFSVCTWGGFDLPWWGVLLSLAVVSITIIPLGIVESISGQRIFTNLEAELIFGFIMPGHINSVMTFKTMTFDLKLGQYLKIPPRVMFGVQTAATVTCAIMNVLVATFVYERIGVDVMNDNPPPGWNAYNYKVFLGSSVVWGAVGSANFIGAGSPYFICLLGLLLGFLAPLIPWILHSYFPNGFWNLVNVPLIATMHSGVGSVHSDMITPLAIAIGVNHFIKRRAFGWWRKYAYTMSSGFDMGSGVGICIVLVVMMVGGVGVRMPFWSMNPVDQEGCASPAYLLCKGRARMGQVVDDGQC